MEAGVQKVPPYLRERSNFRKVDRFFLKGGKKLKLDSYITIDLTITRNFVTCSLFCTLNINGVLENITWSHCKYRKSITFLFLTVTDGLKTLQQPLTFDRVRSSLKFSRSCVCSDLLLMTARFYQQRRSLGGTRGEMQPKDARHRATTLLRAALGNP